MFPPSSPPPERSPGPGPVEGVAAGAGLGQLNPEPLLLSHPGSQEPSPYDESEVHDSFHQLIEEQSRWVAEEGLELQQREPGAGAGASETSGEPSAGPGGRSWWPVLVRRRWDSAGRALSLPCLAGHLSWPTAGLGWGLAGEIAGPPCLQDLWTNLCASQALATRPCWGPRTPLSTAQPHSASWPACPVALLVSGPLPSPGRPGLQAGICGARSWALHPPPSRPLPRGPAQPRAASLGSKNDSRVTGIKIGSWEPSGA